MNYKDLWSLFERTKGNYLKGGPCALIKIKVSSITDREKGPYFSLYNDDYMALACIMYADLRIGCQGEYAGYPGLKCRVAACKGTGPGMPDKRSGKFTINSGDYTVDAHGTGVKRTIEMSLATYDDLLLNINNRIDEELFDKILKGDLRLLTEKEAVE